MGNVKVKLNLPGLRAVMKSAGVQDHLDKVGADVAGTASAMSGEAYGHRVHTADYLAIVNIYPDSKEAAHDNYENNTLLKAMSGYPPTK